MGREDRSNGRGRRGGRGTYRKSARNAWIILGLAVLILAGLSFLKGGAESCLAKSVSLQSNVDLHKAYHVNWQESDYIGSLSSAYGSNPLVVIVGSCDPSSDSYYKTEYCLKIIREHFNTDNYSNVKFLILDNDGKNPGGRPYDDMQSYSYPMIEVFARGGSYGADYYNWGKKNYVPGKTDTRQLYNSGKEFTGFGIYVVKSGYLYAVSDNISTFPYLVADMIGDFNGFSDAEYGQTWVGLRGNLDQNEAYRILPLVNQARARVGAGSLTWDRDLETVAILRAFELCVQWSHDRPNGGTCFSAIPQSYSQNYAAENIAYSYGSESAEQANAQWTASSGHYANMINTNVTRFAAAYVRDKTGKSFWVEVFSNHSGGSTSGSGISGMTGQVVPLRKAHTGGEIKAETDNPATMQPGETLDLGSSIYVSISNWDDIYLMPGRLSWSSSNTGVAMVDSYGRVTAQSPGQAVITAQVPGGIFTKATFQINVPVSLNGASVAAIGAKTYTGNPLQPSPAVSLNGKTLKKGTDYTLSYKNNVNPGKATVTIRGIGAYKGSLSRTFTIKAGSITKAKVTGLTDLTYTGQAQKPSPIVQMGNSILTQGTDYTITYKNNVKAGTATLTLKGTGKKVTGTLSKTFRIKPVDISSASISGVAGKVTTGPTERPVPSVQIYVGQTWKTIRNKTDYTYSYKENTADGTVTLTIKGKGNFTGTRTQEYQDRWAQRLAGANRYQTAYAIADALKKELKLSKFNCAVIASGANYPDALAGAYLAKIKKAPLLVTADGEIANTVAYLKKNLAAKSTIYILGGTGSVSAGIENKLRGISGATVKRLGGKDRYETNLLILKEANVKAGQHFLVCTGLDYRDALSASATGRPLLLVHGKTNGLTGAQRAYLRSVSPKKLWIVGDGSVISGGLASDLARCAAVSRINGGDAVARSVAIAETFFSGRQRHISLAPEGNYPDGLCGGALAAVRGGPLLLGDNYYSTMIRVRNYAVVAGARHVTVFGGATWIADGSVNYVLN
ncbi:MAG: cell wall-binding repeat-containing protein [Clostridia bacterium]|nr:cell wall-binding repeat-containing protein [Clostridia bacterium]